MKRTLAILLGVALLLGCTVSVAETAGKTYLATVDMNGAFRLQCTLPEGYKAEEIESTGASYIALVKAEDKRPLLTLSIAYNELYSDVPRMNDLDEESLALIEESFRAEDEVEISYTETSHGTRLMVVKEAKDTVDYLVFYSVFLGYEIEMAVSSVNEETGLTDAQIQMAVDFLSDLDFVAAEEGAVLSSGDALSEQVEGLHVNIQHETDSPEWVTNLSAAQGADQLFVVAAMGMDKTTAYITMHKKDESGTWKQILSTPGFVGRTDCALMRIVRKAAARHPSGFTASIKPLGLRLIPDARCRISRQTIISIGPAIRNGITTRWWISGTYRIW